MASNHPTTVHEELINEVRAEFFGYATSVVTDRAAAEKAAATLVDPALETYEVHWVASPMAGASLWDSLRASLRASISASLRASLWDSLRDSLWDSLGASLGASLRDSLWDSLGASLGASLRDSLWDAIWDSLRASLRDSLWASIRDSRWTAYWTCAVRITGHTGPDVERLQAFADLARHAFALWVLPGHVILCDKPTSVEVRDGKLLNLQWGDQ